MFRRGVRRRSTRCAACGTNEAQIPYLCAMGNDGLESSFERSLHVDGAVHLDVATHSGVVRVGPGQPGVVRIRGVFRGRRAIFGLGSPADRVAELAASPPIQQSGNTIRVGDVGDRWLLRGVAML